ncbi:MAG: phosphoribosylglycinamide formyltransferase [Chthoniobacterales bacterium]|nr:phosphoribosylglycinamide formyltransferase [Chthoniobacterales bacterium]
MNSSSPLRLGILGSGKGSNFQVLVEAARSKSCYYEPVMVLSDVADAGILKLADQFKIQSRFVEPGPFKTKLSEAIEQEMVAHLQAAQVDFVALAGFMRIVKEPLLKAFPGRILNIHPSLLPQFPGLAAWKQAHEAHVAETGCTVHLVDEGIDTGKILGQSRVPVFPEDTPEMVHARIQQAEHELYPRIVNQFSKDLIASKKYK